MPGPPVARIMSICGCCIRYLSLIHISGSEVTPFSIITDDHEGVKYAVADYALTPSMAIIDSDLVQTMPKGLCSASGIDILTHALESYVSSMATEYTRGLSLEAGKLVFDYLPSSYATADSYAREKVHTAATLAGMAFANAFLGVCHSMAHKMCIRDSLWLQRRCR